MFKHNGPHRERLCRFAVCVIFCLGILGVFIGFSAPAQAQGVQLTKLARTSTGNISAHLPATWTFQDTGAAVYDSTVLAYADSPSALQSVLKDFAGQKFAFQGLGGGVGIFSAQVLQGLAPELAISSLMQGLAQQAQTLNAKVVEQGQITTNAGGVGALMQLVLPGNSLQGYFGFLNFNGAVAFVSAYGTTQNFAENQQLLLAIIQSIHIPAEESITSSGGEEATPTAAGFSFPTLPPEGAPGGEEATPTAAGFTFPTLPPEGTPEAPGSTPSVVRSAGGEVSVNLPAGWASSDLVASDKVLAFGDTQESMQSRVDAYKSSAGAVQVTGNGGLILVLSAADLQVQPPIDAESLLSQELAGGSYQVIEQVQKFDVAGGSGAYAVVTSGGQEGYLALIAFGDKAALVSATGTPETFAASRDLLLTIVKSVHVPAVKGGIGLPSLLGGAGPTPTPQ
jgi:hypothetical protein